MAKKLFFTFLLRRCHLSTDSFYLKSQLRTFLLSNDEIECRGFEILAASQVEQVRQNEQHQNRIFLNEACISLSSSLRWGSYFIISFWRLLIRLIKIQLPWNLTIYKRSFLFDLHFFSLIKNREKIKLLLSIKKKA